MRRSIRVLPSIILLVMLLLCSQGTALASGTPHANNQMKAGVVGFATPSCTTFGCYGRDPGLWHCNSFAMSFVNFTVTDNNGNVLATGRNVYSTGCKANWSEGTLTTFALNQGDSIIVQTTTNDSQKPSQFELTCFPGTNQNTGSPEDCFNFWVAPYRGQQGWPAFSDMVDGTNVAQACVTVIVNSVTGDGFGHCANQ